MHNLVFFCPLKHIEALISLIVRALAFGTIFARHILENLDFESLLSKILFTKLNRP